jgi:Fe-S-cluster containining protein
MPTCLQCGQCCLGIDWTFSYDAPKEDPENLSEEIMNMAVAKLNRYGIHYWKFKQAEKNNDWLSLTFKVGICQHLRYDEGKAYCNIHDNRHPICKGFFCEKAKQADEKSTQS